MTLNELIQDTLQNYEEACKTPLFDKAIGIDLYQEVDINGWAYGAWANAYLANGKIYPDIVVRLHRR